MMHNPIYCHLKEYILLSTYVQRKDAIVNLLNAQVSDIILESILVKNHSNANSVDGASQQKAIKLIMKEGIKIIGKSSIMNYFKNFKRQCLLANFFLWLLIQILFIPG